MSEETTSSVPASETAQPEPVAPPRGAPKKKLWLMIAVVAVVAILIGSSAYVMFLAPMRASMDPDDITIEAGQTMELSVSVKKGIKSLTNNDDTTYRWRLNPDTLASFDMKSRPVVNFTAGVKEGTGEISCEITYKSETVTLKKTVTVKKPFLDQIVIAPSTKTLDKGMSCVFTASAVDSVANPIPNLTYTWSVSGTVAATLNATTGTSVNLTAGTVYGNVTLSASATWEGVTKTGTAQVTIGPLPPRSVDYLWYDMFDVPFGEWWDARWSTYHIEEPLTDAYPYLFAWHGQPPGNVYIYTNMRLNITGHNVSEVSMNENPEFLPLHGTARGGTAVIDWYMQYLTSAEMERYPAATAGWNDGWVCALNGTVRLDKMAAMSVLKDLTNTGYDTFSSWWTTHQSDVSNDLTSWLVAEAGPSARYDMDVYPMYDANYQMLTGSITAAKVGDEIVLTYDLVTWGIEALMTRWMHESFMSTEWYFEDMDFHAVIGPERAEINIDTAVAYAVYAYETTLPPAEPVWVWEALNQDYVPSSPPGHPYSGYDQYMDFDYLNTAPGSEWYGKEMTYDYEPGAFNLTTNETMVIEWPSGVQEFKVHVPANPPTTTKPTTAPLADTMVCVYSEPMSSDNPSLAPGNVVIDNSARKATFTGPIDMWQWSNDQTDHEWLLSEWERMEILPYGAPYIEWKPEHGVPRWATEFVMSGMPEMPVVGTPVGMTVTVLDNYGAVYPSFDGTVHFESNRTDIVLPADYTFDPVVDGGRHTFPASVTFTGTEDYLINMSAVGGNQTGNYTDIWVIPVPEVITDLGLDVIGVRGIVVEGLSTDVRVTAYNQYPAPHNVFKGYSGTVTFATDAPAGTYTLPADAAFSPDNHGVLVLHGLLFEEMGIYTLTVTDTLVPTATETVTVEVSFPPEIHYRIYDMFEQPWGDFWEWRLTGYKTDIVLNDRPHENTMVYNPDTRNLQGIIYAPYRWNLTAVNVTTVNIHQPEFMPVLGTEVGTGGEADMHIWFEYLDNETWDNYWVPTWSGNSNWTTAIEQLMPENGIMGQFADGYYLGVVYTVTMDRQVALEWLGLPLTDDPMTWWLVGGNNDSYMEQWQRWIWNEGNRRLDIWPAYEWPFIDMGTMMDLEVETSGDVTLRIGTMSWGYECLMTRWLNETAISVHEPYMEDFNMSVHYTEDYINMTLDAVAQYNLHAVKANASASNDAAWVWEPQRMDYVWYEGGESGYISEFNPWASVYYTSWNSGDGFLGDPFGVSYDFTPQWFNLTSYMTLDIQLPLGDVIGYAGEMLPTGTRSGAIFDLKAGHDWYYDNITIHGPMELGYNLTGEGPGAPNLWDFYDPVAKKLSLAGPMNFDNFRHENGLLYHSAPWIEFNVANVTQGPLQIVTTEFTVVAPEDVPIARSALSADAGILEMTTIALMLAGMAMAVATISEDLRRKK